MNSHAVRTIHLPHFNSHGSWSLPVDLLLLIPLLGAAFVALWLAVVAETLHPYGNPEPRK